MTLDRQRSSALLTITAANRNPLYHVSGRGANGDYAGRFGAKVRLGDAQRSRLYRRCCVAGIEEECFLAGALNATNVGQAVATVEPFGVDLCSGVRTDDRLDLAKLQGFFNGRKMEP